MGLQAIAYMGDDFMFQLFGKYQDMAMAVKNPCHLNMAACMIKLKRYEEAIGHCSIVRMKFIASCPLYWDSVLINFMLSTFQRDWEIQIYNLFLSL